MTSQHKQLADSFSQVPRKKVKVLKKLRSASKWVEVLYLRHVDLALVHELDDGGDVGVGRVLENDDLVVFVVGHEEVLEVGAAGRQDHLDRKS